MAAKNKFMNAMKMPAIADMFSSEADRQRESGDLVTEVPLSELHPFVNHPFEVRDDEDMQKLVDSIKENGVLTNLTVRPRAEGGYEIISGHRRFHAAQLAGLDKIKVQVRDVDDDQAIIDMVDANIQREHISPMEKARAYAMKLEAISHQGERRQETSNQVGWKLESAHEVGQQAGDSGTQVRRYTYASLEDMNRMALANLDFDSLMEVDINEIEEQEPEISADEPEKSTFVSQVMQDVDRLAAREEPAEYDRTNYLAPYEPAVPEGPKAKFAANVQAIRTLKEIEQRMASGGAPASEQEQDILAGYLGWGGLADAFDPGKDNWHTEYEQLKALLTEDEYAAARESTLTAFYTPPAVIHAMYRALEHIGCVGGNVLEPSMGVGAFFGHRHSKFDTHNAKLYGVELDSLSGRIAQQLYQKAKIQITGYEKADLPDNFFDLAIGNVPFGQYQVSDRRYDKLHFQIHDYFLAKTVDKLRVGGIMAFITTSGTMDKKSEDVRQYLAARCDLIGAVRLPNTTFKSNAGTEVTSDILFLQKRGRVLEQDAPWIHVGETENGIPLNQYFIDHPEMVCGEMQMVSGPYGMRSACVPNEQSPLAEQLDAALSNLHADYTLVDEQEYAEEESGTIDADPNVRNFSYTVKDDVIYYRENSKMRVVKGGDTTLARIRALVPLRDTCRELIDAQLENFPDEYTPTTSIRISTLP